MTYVYGQEKGVWDPQKKQMRSKRTLIGKIDPETGEVVPTAKDIEIAQLRQELHNLTGQ